MNADVKAKWLAALRSGDYRQGTDRLNYGNATYCCLGVLCEIAVAERATEPATRVGDGSTMMYGWSSTTPPEAVMAWAGIDDERRFPALNTGTPLEWTAQNVLIEMNDGQGASFEQIADWVEENL